MLFKILPKEEFEVLVRMLHASNEVIAPKRVALGPEGKPIHQYLPVESFEEIDLSYETTTHSAKTYFLPYKENLSTFDFEEADWTQQIGYRLQPRVLLGLHACDINALLKLDRVLARDIFPSPYYISRRRNTFIIGIDHDPCEGGFCESMGANTVTHGFDLFLTDLGDRYLVEIQSDRGWRSLGDVRTAEVREEDTQDYLAVRKRITNAFKTRVDVRNLHNLLDIEFESPVWREWGDKCLSCGSCAMACPTCYCYGVTERVSMDWKKGTKARQLYACTLQDFATVSGGHNFRPDRQSRLKYRYYHKHRGFLETYGEPQCVGCNRCGRVCLVGINPADVIRDLQMEDTA